MRAYETEDRTPRGKRSGIETSSLKANTFHNDKMVILALNAPEVIMKNSELEAKYQFKIEDIPSLLELFDKKGTEFLDHIMVGCKLSNTDVRKRKVWKLKLHIETLAYSGATTKKLETIIKDIEIDGTVYNCQFLMPSLQIYDPETKDKTQIILDSDTCEKLAMANFDSWEQTCILFFENQEVN